MVALVVRWIDTKVRGSFRKTSQVAGTSREFVFSPPPTFPDHPVGSEVDRLWGGGVEVHVRSPPISLTLEGTGGRWIDLSPSPEPRRARSDGPFLLLVPVSL